MKKKTKKDIINERKKKEDILRKKILKYSSLIPLHDNFINIKKNLDFNNWVKATKISTTSNTNNLFKTKKLIDTNDYYIKCKKIILYPSENNKELLLKWLDDYRKMYNITIKYFNSNNFNQTKNSTNFKYIRTYILKSAKNIIKNINNTPSHTLNVSI